MMPSHDFLYLDPPCPRYSDEAGSKLILSGLLIDLVPMWSQLTNNLTLVPTTMMPRLFQLVERAGTVKVATGLSLCCFSDVRYNDTSLK